MSFKLLNKVVSILTLVAFLGTNITYAAPESKSIFKNKKVNFQKISDKNEGIIQQKKAVLTGEDAKEVESQKREAQKILSTHLSDISLIHIPQELGKVVEVYQNPDHDNSRLIVHIQDLHTNPEATLNLAGILEILVKDYNLGLVCSEGADGEVDTSSVSSFPDPEVRKKVARLFVDSGELTGEEYLSITKYPDLPIWGIENKDIYFKNIEEFNNIMKFNPDSQVFISQAKKALEELKPKIYSKELLAIDQKEADYENQKVETADYLKYLSSYIQKLNISTDKYKNIAILNETIDKESKIDQQKIMQESQNLLLNLQSAIAAKSNRSDMDTLMAKASFFKDQKISPFSFYSYLKDLADKHLKDQVSKYPNLMDFVDYLTKVNSLESVKLFVEMEELAYEIKQKLAKNDEEKTLTQALRSIKFLEGFFNLKISNEELDYYLNNRDFHKVAFFEAFLKPAIKKYNLSGFVDFNPNLIDSHLQYIEDFYKTVKARDLAMFTNTTSEVEKRNVKVATLITGGFHTQGITKLLREKGYSYIVISPFSKTEIDEENYHFLLSGKRKPIEDLIRQLDVPETSSKVSANNNLRVPMISVERVRGAIGQLRGETSQKTRLEPKEVKSAAVKRLTEALENTTLIIDTKETAAEAVIEDLVVRLGLDIRDLRNVQFSCKPDWSGATDRALELLTVQSPDFSHKYVIKNSTKIEPSVEFDNSILVSSLEVGPTVIFTSIGHPNKYLDIMIEDYLEQAKGLSKEEEFLVGRKLAEKMYIMLDTSRKTVTHRFDNLKDHLFVVRKGKDIDVRFIDWGRAFNIMNESVRARSSEALIERMIIEIKDSELFNHQEVVLASFIARLREIALQNSQGELDFYNDILDKAYSSLTDERGSYRIFSQGYREMYAKADPLIGEIDSVFGTFSATGLTARMVGQVMKGAKGWLERGWTLANHVLVSFHSAFILSILVLPAVMRGDVLSFMFFSPETLASIGFLWASYHTGVAIHEMGHYIASVKVGALNSELLPEAEKMLQKSFLKRLAWYAKMFVLMPYGRFSGVIRTGLSYHPDAEYNLAQTSAGPRWSRNLSFIALPIAAILIGIGLFGGNVIATYIGRFAFGMGIVGFLDFKMADPGEYKKFKERERLAALRAEEATKKAEKAGRWIDRVAEVKKRMIETRPQMVRTKDGLLVWAPWQFRNCGMGGRHTEKQYPNSNISMQETMFNPLSPKNYEDAQEMTMKLQTRLQEIIESAEGCRVMGIGLEGGLAPYITKEAGDIVPEQRLWRMAKQAILDCGYVPGVDVAIALDPASSELENAYREENNDPKAIGMYLFWRDKEKVVMTRDELYDFFRKTIEDDDIPIVSIEDGFAEDDDAGWKLINEKLGDKLFIIGDDSVTTKDSSIEYAADNNLNNTFLCKANQIGTLSETLLAILVALGKNLEIVVSHRSKSPNDDMEAQIALACFAAGLKTGGGANTERLMKYGSVMRIMAEAVKAVLSSNAAEMSPLEREAMLESEKMAVDLIDRLVITEVSGVEEATNAGIPTVKVRISFGIEGSSKFKGLFPYEGSTPLGTSAGTGEAIHLVDSVIYESQIPDAKYNDLFSLKSDGSYRFKKGVTMGQIDALGDPSLTELFRRSQRYEGKGCLNAVDNVNTVLSKNFIGLSLKELGGIVDIDRKLLNLEMKLASERGQLKDGATEDEKIAIMQRKGNIGMNAILSQSLAGARLLAALQGKELYQTLREKLTETMAKTIAENGGLDILPEDIKKKVSIAEGQELWDALDEHLDFFELKRGLQIINANKPKDVKLYELLRDALPVYKDKVVSQERLASNEGLTGVVQSAIKSDKDASLASNRNVGEFLSKETISAIASLTDVPESAIVISAILDRAGYMLGMTDKRASTLRWGESPFKEIVFARAAAGGLIIRVTSKGDERRYFTINKKGGYFRLSETGEDDFRGSIKVTEVAPEGIVRVWHLPNNKKLASGETITMGGIKLITGEPDLSKIQIEESNNRAVLRNIVTGKSLRLELNEYKGKKYAKIGSGVYLIKGNEINIFNINPIGNDAWFDFFGKTPSDIRTERYYVDLPFAAKEAVLFPANRILQPSLLSDKTENNAIRQKLQAYKDGDVADNIQDILHFSVIVGLNGTPEDYYLAQDVLNKIIKLGQYQNDKSLIVSVSDYLYLAYRGVDWDRMDRRINKLRAGDKDKKTAERTQTIYERSVEFTRLAVPDLENWKVVHVEALSEDNLEYISEDLNSESVREGGKAISEGKVVSVPFMGGSATTVKKKMGKHKMIHEALKVRVQKGNEIDTEWINIAQARIGLILGQNKDSQVVVVTSVDGTEEGDSDRSIRDYLDKEYKIEIAKRQMGISIQRAGLVLNPTTGEPLKFSDGHIATCAENHLWAFLSMVMDKDLVTHLLESSDGIVFVGNGDNPLNYPRKGMAGEILKARKEGKPIATIAVCSPSRGDKKGGFAARVTYRNSVTGQEISQVEMREVSEFPTRAKETGFKAVDLSKERNSDLYRRLDEGKLFVEDIFGDKNVAFNVAFYAVDLRLFIARIFGFDENDPGLIAKLANIDRQSWADRVIDLAEKVPETVQPNKEVPNENNTDRVNGYMTEQAVQDFIVNAMGLLPRNGVAPEVKILLGTRQDMFWPYKGTDQDVMREDGSVVTDESGKPKTDYDLIANMSLGIGAVKRLAANGHYILLGENDRVLEILPVTLQEVIDANKTLASNEGIDKGAKSEVESMDQIIVVSAESVIANEKGFEAWMAQLPANNAVVVIASSEEYENVRKFENIVYIKVLGKDINQEYGLKLIEMFGAYGKSEFFGGFKLGIPASIDEYRSLAAEISSGV